MLPMKDDARGGFFDAFLLEGCRARDDREAVRGHVVHDGQGEPARRVHDGLRCPVVKAAAERHAAPLPVQVVAGAGSVRLASSLAAFGSLLSVISVIGPVPDRRPGKP
jgi:hypothetical protein